MKFEKQNEPTNALSILEFERDRGVRLPEDYRTFLLEYNGGYLDRSNDYFEVGNWNAFIVEDLLGLTSDAESSIATRRFNNFSDYIDLHFLVIGHASGEVLFMDLREISSYGEIYVRAHDSPINDPILIDDQGFSHVCDYEDAQLFHPVANSFAEFIAMLGPEPEED
jgi:SMI1 / KNR4 family (SUKH-1)